MRRHGMVAAKSPEENPTTLKNNLLVCSALLSLMPGVGAAQSSVDFTGGTLIWIQYAGTLPAVSTARSTCATVISKRRSTPRIRTAGSWRHLGAPASPLVGKDPRFADAGIARQGRQGVGGGAAPAGAASAELQEHSYTLRLRARGSGPMPADVAMTLLVAGPGEPDGGRELASGDSCRGLGMGAAPSRDPPPCRGRTSALERAYRAHGRQHAHDAPGRRCSHPARAGGPVESLMPTIQGKIMRSFKSLLHPLAMALYTLALRGSAFAGNGSDPSRLPLCRSFAGADACLLPVENGRFDSLEGWTRASGLPNIGYDEDGNPYAALDTGASIRQAVYAHFGKAPRDVAYALHFRVGSDNGAITRSGRCSP